MAQPPKDKQPETPPVRRNRAAAVSRDAAGLSAQAFARAGFTDPALVLHWEEIAGPDVARIARPIRLSEGPSGGVLTLKAEPAASLFLQHESRALCARINSWLGREAVGRLRFVQGPLVPGRPAPRPPKLKGKAAQTDPVHSFEGPETLKQALQSLADSRARPRGD